jgi:phosphoenolpyruvate carboxykinase (GTP)
MRDLLQNGQADGTPALFDGCMRGRTMYVVPFSMGPLGSHIAHIGIELSDSAYVAVNMKIMTRMGRPVYDVLGEDGEFVPCVHSVGAPLAPARRRALAVQQDQVHRALPGDARDLVLRLGLRRQCLAGQEVFCAAHRVHMGRSASQGSAPGWLAEHMLILGVHQSAGQASTMWRRPSPAPAARPISRCWCRRPASRLEGHDDRRRHRLDQAPGRRPLYAINPEAGYFGVAPGTNMRHQPQLHGQPGQERDLHQRRAHR